SSWLYPFLEIIHIVGLVFVAGAAMLFDFRLLSRNPERMSPQKAARLLLPWSRRGLLFVIPSGVLLFITNAVALGRDPTFLVKLILLALAGANALIFHLAIFKPYLKNHD